MYPHVKSNAKKHRNYWRLFARDRASTTLLLPQISCDPRSRAARDFVGPALVSFVRWRLFFFFFLPPSNFSNNYPFPVFPKKKQKEIKKEEKKLCRTNTNLYFSIVAK